MQLLLSLLLSALSLTTSQLVVPLSARALPNQLPIMPTANNDDAHPPTQPAVPLTDILGTQRSLTTFSSFARLHDSTTALLSDLSVNTTILAPLNSAIEGLPRKPWEDPREYAALGADAYDGDGGQDRARQNLKKFVEAHLVGVSPWEEGDKAETVGGRKVWWETKDGKRVVMPDEVEVEKVASQVANGELWIIKGVLNYA